MVKSKWASMARSAAAVGALLLGGSAAADPFVAPEPEDLSFYHVFIDRFENGDPSNDDGNPRAPHAPTSGTGFHGGDLEGVRQRLPYIRGMGFNAIWLSPFLENVSNYHGYATYDWYNVDPNFGTLDEIKALVEEANALGMAVYYDLVANHCGDIIDSTDPGYSNYLAPPSTYNLRWRTGLQYPAPFNSLSYFHAHGRIQNFNAPEQELGELSGLDDLKTDTQYVRDRMAEIWSYWIEETGVNGFRIDTVKHVEMGFWDDFLPRVRATAATEGRDNFFIFGEIYGADDSFMTPYLGTLSSPAFRLDAALDFQFYYTTSDVFALGTGNTSNVTNRLSNRASSLGTHHLKMPNFFDNHDVRRFMNVANNDNPGSGLAERLRRLDLGIVFLMTAPGPPVMYYGTEQAFDGGNDPSNREDMFDGGYEFGPSLGNNFDPASPRYGLTRRLNELRTARIPLRRGTLVTHQTSGGGAGMLAYSRRHAGEEVLVIMNTATANRSQNAINTTWTDGQVVVDVLNPVDTVTITAGGVFPARTAPAQAAQVWVREEDVPLISPESTGTDPANNQSNVSTTTDITITFSVPMNTSTTEAAFSINPLTPCTLSWELGDTRLRINPDVTLSSTTSYTATIAASATSTDGAPLLFPVSTTFSTGRDVSSFPPLPPTMATFGPTIVAITADGNGSEWAGSSQSANTIALTPSNVVVWRDATGDDNGPGTYTYPTNSAFTTGDADILEFRVAMDSVFFYFYIKPVSINPAASFFTPYFGIAIDTQDGGRLTSLGVDQGTNGIGIAELEVRPDAAPEFELVFTGPAGADLLSDTGALISGSVSSGFSQSTGEIEITLPRLQLGLGGTLSNQRLNLVVYSGLETFGGMREVSNTTASFTPGGGSTSANDPDVFDLIGASGANQHAELSDWNTSIPAMVIHSVLTLRASDSLSAVGEWQNY